MLERFLFLGLALTLAAMRAAPANELIYDEKADAASDVRAAVRQASLQHKNTVLVTRVKRR